MVDRDAASEAKRRAALKVRVVSEAEWSGLVGGSGMMRTESLPVIDARYWVAISIASVFGANMGDLVSHDLHLGHWRGLPVLAGLFALVLLGERRRVLFGEAWYWVAIVLLRTAATNLGDLATHDFRADPVLAMVCLLAALAGFVAAGRRGLAGGAGGAVRPAGDGWYWAAMLTAGTLGNGGGRLRGGRFGLGVRLGDRGAGRGAGGGAGGRRTVRVAGEDCLLERYRRRAIDGDHAGGLAGVPAWGGAGVAGEHGGDGGGAGGRAAGLAGEGSAAYRRRDLSVRSRPQ